MGFLVRDVFDGESGDFPVCGEELRVEREEEGKT
jgi:hypothetical protein